jgi:hypothetical protein
VAKLLGIRRTFGKIEHNRRILDHGGAYDAHGLHLSPFEAGLSWRTWGSMCQCVVRDTPLATLFREAHESGVGPSRRSLQRSTSAALWDIASPCPIRTETDGYWWDSASGSGEVGRASLTPTGPGPRSPLRRSNRLNAARQN